MNEEKYLAEFIEQLATYTNKKDLKTFLEAILTPKELIDIPQRLQIVKMLKQEIPQRKIADTLGVGVATVTRGSKEIKKGNFQDIK